MTTIRPTALLTPRSVAVVGATERPGSYGDTVVRNLIEAGFPGPVHPINPGRETVHGLSCLPSLLDLPEAVDAVVIAVPAPAVTPAIREAIETGCGGAVVVSAGFGETEAGEALEAELAEVAREAAFPVCGPNGNGVISFRHRAPLWGDSVPAGIGAGSVAMISQSGNVAVNAIGSKRGIGFHTMVSTGNQAVLDTGDWLGSIAELDGVRAIALFQEADGDGAKLAEALATCAEREIGVAVLKVGTSQAGQAAAAAHTGAIAGDQKVFRALIEEAGAAWATDPHELLEITRVLAEPRALPRRAGGPAVLTCSGGDSGIAADQAEQIGLEFPELEQATINRLSDLLPDAVTPANPLDYTSLIWDKTDLLSEIVATVGADPNVNQLLLFHDHPEDLREEHREGWSGVRRGLASGALRNDTPAVLASTLPDLVDPEARAELAESGIPVVGGIPAALAALKASQRSMASGHTVVDHLRAIAASVNGLPRPDENGGEWLSEHQAKSMLRSAGIAVPDSHIALTPSACLDAAAGLDFPVALKLSASSIQHKSELGAVRIGIPDEAALLAAAEDLMSVAGQIHLRAAQGRPVGDQPGQAPDPPEPPVFLVEEMAGEGIEVIISARSDALVPSMTIGLGGIWAEYLADSVVVPLPATPETVRQALTSLKAFGLLSGQRGAKGADLDALASFASKVGHLLLDYRDPSGRGFDLIELNPVVASHEGAVALDAVAHLA
jgi:acetyl-CoA synthetase